VIDTTQLHLPVRRRVRRELGRALTRRRRLRNSLVQLIYATAALVLAAVTPELDVGTTVDGDRVSTLAISIGAGVITFVGVVYSLLFLVVQFGTTTYSPRLNLFRDAPLTWHAFAFFVAIIVYCFALPWFIDDEVTVVVPVLIVVSLLIAFGLFAALQQTAFTFIQLAAVLDKTTDRGRRVVDGIYTSSFDPDVAKQPHVWSDDGVPLLWSGSYAVIEALNVPRLMRIAVQHDIAIEFHVGVGSSVHGSESLATLHGDADDRVRREVLECVTTARERSFEQDPALALRALADIAIRALSPAVNDPSTASQAVDGIETLLGMLGKRDLNVGEVRDDADNLRLSFQLPTWEEYVALGLDEVIYYGHEAPQVIARLDAAVEGLIGRLPAERAPALEARLASVRANSERLGLLRSTEVAAAEPHAFDGPRA
jgi:uncharacterized membrane protein